MQRLLNLEYALIPRSEKRAAEIGKTGYKTALNCISKSQVEFPSECIHISTFKNVEKWGLLFRFVDLK